MIRLDERIERATVLGRSLYQYLELVAKCMGASSAGEQLIQFLNKHPKQQQVIAQYAKEHFGPTLLCYRGIAVEKVTYGYAHRFTDEMKDGDVYDMVSNSHKVYSWTYDLNIAWEFASQFNKYTGLTIDDGYGIIFEANIPIDMIVFAAPLFDFQDIIKRLRNRESKEMDAQIQNKPLKPVFSAHDASFLIRTFQAYWHQQEIMVHHSQKIHATIKSFHNLNYGDTPEEDQELYDPDEMEFDDD